MQYQTYIPQPPLSTFIEFFWYISSNNPISSKMLSFSDSSIDLVIDLHRSKISIHNLDNPYTTYKPFLIIGPHTNYFVTEFDKKQCMIGAHFLPGRAVQFLQMPASELYNTNVGLHDIWGRLATDLRDELLYAEYIDEKFHILEKYLLSKINWSQSPNPAIQYALTSFQKFHYNKSIDNMVAQVNMNAKKFIQVFKNEVGLTPKRFCRIVRFHQSIQLITQCNSINWIDIAMSCNYYDQSHFIHEFKTFSGLTPAEYYSKKFFFLVISIGIKSHLVITLKPY